jgi:hypothetical protein
MTDTNQKYLRLAKALKGTRNTLVQTCRDLNIDIDDVQDDLLQNAVDQCSHCNIWSDRLIEDLDGMPICRVCERLVGR